MQRALSACLATPVQMSPQHLGAHVRAAKLGNMGARAPTDRPTNTICPNGRGIKLEMGAKFGRRARGAFFILAGDVREREPALLLIYGTKIMYTQKQQKCTHRCPSGCTHRCHGDTRGVGGAAAFSLILPSQFCLAINY
jgi:hypothetical protein